MLQWGRGLSILAILSGVGVAGGCATVTNGTSQALDIESEPLGAQCILTREGKPLGSLVTPGQITVSRSRHAINVSCRKVDYQDTGHLLLADREPASYASVAVPLGIGSIVDSSTGAYAAYPTAIKVWLVPNDASADRVGMASVTPAAAGTFDGRYYGTFRRHAIVQSDDPITMDVQVATGRGTGTAKTDACAVPGDVSLVVDSSGMVIGTFQLKDASCHASLIRMTGQINGGHINIALAKRFAASLDKQP